MGDGYGLRVLARCEVTLPLFFSARCEVTLPLLWGDYLKNGGIVIYEMERGMRRDHTFKQREAPVYEILPDTKKPLLAEGLSLPSKLLLITQQYEPH